MKVCKPDIRRQCFPLTFRPLIWGCVAVAEGTGQDLDSPRERPWLSGEARVGTHSSLRCLVNVKRVVMCGEMFRTWKKSGFCITGLLRASRKEQSLSFFKQHDLGVVKSTWLQY